MNPPSIDPAKYNANNRFAIMHRSSTMKFRNITDGSTNTIAVVECSARPCVYRQRAQMLGISNDQGITSADSEGSFSFDGSNDTGSAEGCLPANGCNRVMNRRDDNESYNFHEGGGNFQLADGRVQFLSENVDFMTFAVLCTRGAGEVITGSEY